MVHKYIGGGRYRLGKEVGRGSFAAVYQAYDQATIKAVSRARLTPKLLSSLECEISILKTLNHPNIVALTDCLKSDSHIYLVMEYCSGGDLSGCLKNKDVNGLAGPSGGLTIDATLHFLRQLASALSFLRSRSLIHRDIKPQNLLLVPRKAEGTLPLVKLADFGFARHLPTASLAETLCGSPLYMAPEILRYEHYDAKADLWSVGTVSYELIVGRPPFRASNHVELLRRIEKTRDHIRFPEDRTNPLPGCEVDPALKDLIRRLLKRNPVERMSFEEFF
ncbi:MAG: kinase-like domain-containing protein, partial [Piptocephalis tieghemiana]